MNFNEAILKRIQEICEEKNLSVSKLSLKGGITPSVIYDIKTKGKVPSIITLKKLCDGVNKTLSEFFDRDYINQIEFDILFIIKNLIELYIVLKSNKIQLQLLYIFKKRRRKLIITKRKVTNE